jgi:hypothetical protein
VQVIKAYSRLRNCEPVLDTVLKFSPEFIRHFLLQGI